MVQITAGDEDLIALLRVYCGEPVSAPACKLGLSRTTVQDRLKRQEEPGIIAAEPRRQADVARQLSRFAEIETLHTVSGEFELAAQVRIQSSEAKDELIDDIGQIPGITRIDSSVILSTKLDRR